MKSNAFVLIATIVAAAMLSSVGNAQQCKAASRVSTNNCSAPWEIAIASGDLSAITVTQYGNRKFKKACNRHDRCYGAGFCTYGKSRLTCDKEWLRDMKKVCKKMSHLNPERHFCFAVANIYYEGVRLAGGSHYSKSDGKTVFYEGPSPTITPAPNIDAAINYYILP